MESTDQKNIPTQRLFFLHIPKTAGQSVHHFLTYFFSKEDISPTRVNNQLATMSAQELNKYRLFSGHLDWSLLDGIEGRRFTFTVLREPVARIVSFYLYLRREAEHLSSEELNQPYNSGKKAILELSCDDYFTAGPPHLRMFLDNHYDNFYTNYFAGRTYDSFQKFQKLRQVDPSFSEEKVLNLAFNNLTLLDGVFPVDRLDLLEDEIRKAMQTPVGGPTLKSIRMNTGDTSSIEERLQKLKSFGATQRTFERIHKMTEFDQKIWEKYGSKSA